MAGYTYNRQSFTGAPTALAAVYCRCVVLELALKEELQLIGSTGNGGHNVPVLLHSFANTKLGTSVLGDQVRNLSGQLGTRLSALWCQDRNGGAIKVKANSYPYLRYLRHQTDGWSTPSSSDADLQMLDTTVSAVWIALKSAGINL